MIIRVKDEEGLGIALMMDGYSQEQIIGAKHAIRDCFRDAAKTVFLRIFGAELPETVDVNMAPDNNLTQLASFLPERSSTKHLVFYIREKTVKIYIAGENADVFKAVVMHEMIHAADLSILARECEVQDGLIRQHNEIVSDTFYRKGITPCIALLHLLSMLGHYRAEGVALTGEYLLMKKAFDGVDPWGYFQLAFVMTLARSSAEAAGENVRDAKRDEFIHRAAYPSALVITLNVLSNLGNIGPSAFKNAMGGLKTGNYEMSEEEMFEIIRSAQSLSLPEYIRGLLQMGNTVSTMRSLLELCGRLQADIDNDNIEAFAQMACSAKSEKTFKDAMKVIMGSFIKEEDLDNYYADFLNCPADPMTHPKLKEQVSALYDVMKHSEDPEEKSIAQWALTYFFDPEDLIHDDLPDLGLVDDVMVVDYALQLING